METKNYREKATSRLVKEVKVEPVRGNIMDRTGTLYAKTELKYNVYIYKGKKSNKELNEMGKVVIDILNKNEESYLNYLPITRDLTKFTQQDKGVLENWKKKGFTTIEQVDDNNQKYKDSKNSHLQGRQQNEKKSEQGAKDEWGF